MTGHFNADKAEHAGCIVAYSQNSRITGCVSTASINGHHSFQSATGGIVGIADSSTQVSDCINYGTVKCITSEYNFTNAGGIVGWLAGSSNITNCSNFGTVIGLTYGGYVPPIYVGGIVGSAWTKSISDCYNAGAVESMNKVIRPPRRRQAELQDLQDLMTHIPYKFPTVITLAVSQLPMQMQCWAVLWVALAMIVLPSQTATT